MKLKVRSLLALVVGVGLTLVLFSSKLLNELPSFLNSKDTAFSDPLAREALYLADRGSRGSEAAHIHFPRKDLDESNYTSDNFSPEKDKLLFRAKIDDYNGKSYDGIAVQRPQKNDFEELSRNKHTEVPQIKYFKPDIGTQVKLTVLEDTVKRSLLDNEDVKEFEKDNLFAFNRWRIPKSQRLPLYKKYPRTNLTSWERFHLGITRYALYDPKEGAVDAWIRDLVNHEFIDVEEKSGGTQLKLLITFQNDGMTLFKPQRFGRDYETPPNHFYFVDFERHNAEIAAYHLDRVLGFYRVPPTVGRVVNVTRDLHRLANRKLAKTFFVSPAKNHCFHGTCSYYCDTTHAVCGSPDMLEGSFSGYLSPEIAPRKSRKHPWKRSYSKRRKAIWEDADDYCDDVREDPMFKTGRRLIDIMDMAVFDFLIGNMDRHNYQTFEDFGNNTFLIHLDHGRSFGKTKHDEISILAPIYQCCLIRRSTFMKLLGFYKGPIHLSDLMRKSMSTDRIAPILLEPHLEALDRRVSIILKIVSECIERDNRIDQVIVDDGF